MNNRGGGGGDWRNGASSVAFLLSMMLRVLASPRALRLDSDYLRPVYMEKSCPEWKGHPPTRATRATLSEPPFQTSTFFLILTLFKVVSIRRVTLLLGTSFLHFNGAEVRRFSTIYLENAPLLQVTVGNHFYRRRKSTKRQESDKIIRFSFLV